ncbi:MAG TPA: Ig-like domain-containing protein [Gemmatimonadales bacterium]|nr:Ig-like domain-containing protein [Gemmatimonadales bacterium]
MHFELYFNTAGTWFWRLKSRNGLIIADSSEGYSTRAKALAGLKLVKSTTLSTKVKELTKPQPRTHPLPRPVPGSTPGTISDTATITVKFPPEADTVEVSPSTAELEIGQTVQLTAVVKDSDGNVLSRTITWSSSSTALATVSSTGLVTGVAGGVATITASVGILSGTSTVTQPTPQPSQPGSPNRMPVASVVVSPATATKNEGTLLQMTATLKDQNGSMLSGRETSWSSSDSNIATVSSGGIVSAKQQGIVTITATSEGLSGSSTFTVVRL